MTTEPAKSTHTPTTVGERRYEWRTHGMVADDDGSYVLATDLRLAAPQILAACDAALAYDAAIQRRVIDGTVNIIDTGGGVAMGDDLDELYADWITKSRAAIEAAGGTR